MKATDFRKFFTEELTPIYGKDETESLFNLASEGILNLRRIDFAIDPTIELSAEQFSSMQTVLEKLRREIPIQYILGNAHFFGLIFNVTPDVLIPRQETEELVKWIIDDCLSKKHELKILDIGTGSGCIAVSLAKNMNSDVSAIDVSSAALNIARTNAANNNVSIAFSQIDILANDPEGKYDVIVSNPPYVRILEKAEIRKNVLDNEPHLALFVDDNDPLLFYRRVSELATEHLADDGSLYFEINQYLGKETAELLSENFNDVVLRQDIYGNDRMIRARKPK